MPVCVPAQVGPFAEGHLAPESPPGKSFMILDALHAERVAAATAAAGLLREVGWTQSGDTAIATAAATAAAASSAAASSAATAPAATAPATAPATAAASSAASSASSRRPPLPPPSGHAMTATHTTAAGGVGGGGAGGRGGGGGGGGGAASGGAIAAGGGAIIPSPSPYAARRELLRGQLPAVVRPPLPVDHAVARLMKRYVPAAVVPKLDAGLDVHIAELREVSVLFINCHGVHLAADPPPPNGATTATGTGTATGTAAGAAAGAAVAGGAAGSWDVARAQRHGMRVMREVQKDVSRWEGAVNKMLVDDKGAPLIVRVAWPPWGRHGWPPRAPQAA